MRFSGLSYAYLQWLHRVGAEEATTSTGRASGQRPVVLRRPWAETHKEALVRYVRALGEAFTFIRDPAKRSSVIKTIVETTGSTEAVAKQTLGLFFEPERGVLPKKAEINLKGLEQVIAFMGEAGNLKPPLPAAERFVDFQYLHAAGVK